ncbi:NADPH:quinone reductase-like Zn-dependent oxidoreductase [Kibdelosporangium banguiense]|uniref:NADPH:quinone reductase-like Zn-dependent oxidoreductase n=1 Tax=Kibdelosporangium banguiense TaxID=1365924 RepID=A0ABS4TTW3_9PSEU|nr:hypothetical protein [Kibdelosporangium banguiense]MBP2327820.1 NADPH:quinone reductase-like Zn-dependent oxidoreductase [Kibdelosporangium banguiense]
MGGQLSTGYGHVCRGPRYVTGRAARQLPANWPPAGSSNWPPTPADGFDGIVDLVGGTSLRTVAPLARDPRNVIAVGEMRCPISVGVSSSAASSARTWSDPPGWPSADSSPPVITAVHPLSDAPAALATVENGHTSGKVIIKVA